MNNEQNAQVEQILSQYQQPQQEVTMMEELKALDRKVKLPALIFAYSFGIFSALVMGFGMSLAMTDFYTFFGLTNGLVAGISIGVAGLVMAALNWPIYQAILNGRKKKFAPQILELTEKLLQP